MQRLELSSREIDHFGSVGFSHTRVARGETFQVSLVRLDGVIGGHEAASRQVLVVVTGRVVCAADGEELELRVGDAVEWQEGEWHETRSLEPSTVLIVEGDW